MAEESAFARERRKEEAQEERRAIPKEEIPQPQLGEEKLDALAKLEKRMGRAEGLVAKAVEKIPAGKEGLKLEDAGRLDEARGLLGRALAEIESLKREAAKLSKGAAGEVLAESGRLEKRALYGKALVHQLKCTLYDNVAGELFLKEAQGVDVERYDREGGEFEEMAGRENREALRIYARLTREMPTPQTFEVYNNAALAHLRENEFDGALALLKRVVGAHLPNELKVSSMLMRSMIYREKAEREEDGEAALGIYGQALAECGSALQVSKHSEAALLERARVHSEMGEIEEKHLRDAIADYKELAVLLAGRMRLSPDVRGELAAVYKAVAGLHERLGERKEAERYRSEAASLS